MSRLQRRAQKAENRRLNKRGSWVMWHRRFYSDKAVLRNGVFEVTVRNAENGYVHLMIRNGTEDGAPSTKTVERIVGEVLTLGREFTVEPPSDALTEGEKPPVNTSTDLHVWVYPLNL